MISLMVCLRISATFAFCAILLAASALPGASARADDLVSVALSQSQQDSPERAAVWSEHEAAIGEAMANMIADPQRALERARLAARLLAPLPEGDEKDTGLATAYWLQGEALTRVGQGAEALPIIATGIELAERADPDSKLLADLLVARGRASNETLNINAALNSFQQAHEIYVALEIPRSQAIALQNLAGIYNEAGDNERALEYYDRAFAAYSGDPGLDLPYHNNRANALKELGRYEEALADYQRALSIAVELDSPVTESRILGNIVDTQTRIGDPAGALAAANRAEAFLDLEEIEGRRTQILARKAQALHAGGEQLAAEAYIARAFRDIDLTATEKSFMDLHQVAYRIWRDAAEPDRALAHLEAFQRLNTQARDATAELSNAILTAQFDFASQQLEIETLRANRLEQDIRLAEAAERQRLMVIGTVALVALIMMTAALLGYVSMRRNRNRVQAINEELEQTNIELQEANQAKSEFLASTSHEIRTPLNGILGMAEVMMVEDSMNAVDRERVETIQAAGETMLAIVDDILDLSKLRSGRLKIAAEPVRFKKLVREAGTLWQAPARNKGLEFHIDDSAAPELIEADEKRVRQLLFNLISNAVKFTHEGEVRIKAEAVETEAGERLRVIVSDTGIGIPEDELEQVFESFHQVDGGSTRKFGGTGLGLSIVRHVADAMGGDIHVDSVVGEGSTFTLDLPLKRLEPMEPASTSAEDRPSATKLAELKVLIAEDNGVNRAVLEAMLKNSVGDIQFAEDGEQALEAMKREHFDIVLMDKQMPNMDGVTATRQIRELPGPAGDAYIIAVTADAFEDSRAQMLACGMDDFIAKPVGLETLLGAMRKALSQDLKHGGGDQDGGETASSAQSASKA